MNRQIEKLQRYLNEYLGKEDCHIFEKLGTPIECYDNVFVYERYYKVFFRDEIVFYIKEERVVDISITEYFLWIGLRNIFYYKGKKPEYKITDIRKKFSIMSGLNQKNKREPEHQKFGH